MEVQASAVGRRRLRRPPSGAPQVIPAAVSTTGRRDRTVLPPPADSKEGEPGIRAVAAVPTAAPDLTAEPNTTAAELEPKPATCRSKIAAAFCPYSRFRAR